MAIGLGIDAMAAELDAPLLPQSAVEALARLDDRVIDALVAAAAQTLADGRGNQSYPREIEADAREAYAAICCILTRCARDCNAPTLYRQHLIDCGLRDDALVARLTTLFHKHMPTVQAVLRATSYDFAHVVDISWRLDYILRSSSQGHVHEPVYYVQLKVQPPQGAKRDVHFSCSVEKMRDLVYRLQDATHTIEKIASGPRVAVE